MKKHKYEIERTLVASTQHITPHDNELLTYSAIASRQYEYGYVLYAGGDHASHVDMLSGLVGQHASAALYNLLVLAYANKCLWLRLDADGPVYSALPTFDW
jgi:hypothetical protein